MILYSLFSCSYFVIKLEKMQTKSMDSNILEILDQTRHFILRTMRTKKR